MKQMTNGPTWGPVRPLFTNEKPASYAVFNSITNNAAVGDERAFVRIAERYSGNKLTNRLTIEPDKQYVVSIYYHNDASSTFNTEEYNHVGVAMDVRVVSSFPLRLHQGEGASITGKICSTNTNPPAVWASAYIIAAEDMTLSYVEATAKIYNDWKMNGHGVSRYLFSNEGVFIGLDKLNGIIFGCDEYSGQVAYVLQTHSIR